MGVGFHAFTDIPSDADVTMTLAAMGLEATTRIRVCHKQQSLNTQSRRDGNAASWRYGAQFVDPSTQALAVIWRLCADYATARMYEQFNGHKKGLSEKSIERILNACSQPKQRIALPLKFIAADDSSFKTVSEAITSRTTFALANKSLNKDDVYRIQIAGPLGVIESNATVTSVHPIVLGCSLLYGVEFELDRFKGEGRSLLLSLTHASDEVKLRQVVKLRPPERELPKARPALLVGGLAIAATVLTILGSFTINRSDWVLASAHDGRDVSQSTKTELEQLLASALDDKTVDEAQLVRLREIFQNMHDSQSVSKIDQAMIKQEVKTFSAMLCQAQILDGANRYDEAHKLYVQLLETLNSAADLEERENTIIAAARNCANRLDYTESVKLFAMLSESMFDQLPELRREYAGLLAKTNQKTKSIEILRSIKSPSVEDHYLLACMLSFDEQFTEAIATCEVVLQQSPDRVDALMLQADCYLGLEDFSHASVLYGQVLRTEPSNSQAERKYALSLLWDKQATQAIGPLSNMLKKQPNDEELLAAFIDAALQVQRLNTSQASMLLSIAQRFDVAASADESTRLLVAALYRHKQSSALLPILSEYVRLHPTDVDHRMQLVDMYSSIGKYKEAESHMAILLTRTRSGSEPTKTHLVRQIELDDDVRVITSEDGPAKFH
jgi:tetratricopeptide (TPR) repeat protein